MIVRDRHGETIDAMLADLSAETIGAHLKPVVAQDAALVTDGNNAYQAFAAATDITQIALSPARASGRPAAITRTSMPIRAASSSGWLASRAWPRSIRRATSAGDA